MSCKDRQTFFNQLMLTLNQLRSHLPKVKEYENNALTAERNSLSKSINLSKIGRLES